MFKKRIVLAIVLTITSVVQSGTDPFLELCFEAQFNTPPAKEVKNIPESIRNVPPHHDDDWKATPGPIRQDSADVRWLAEIRFLKLGLETNLNESVIWRNYVDLSFDYGRYLRIGGDIHRRNYTNAPDTETRGYGAALTFWSPGYDIFIPGFKSELQFKDKDQGFYFLGTGLRHYNLGIITGYDRYDRLSERDFFEIGKISEISLYLGGRSDLSKKNRFAEGRLGVNFNIFDEKDKYPDVDVETNKISFFVAFNFGYRF